MKKAILFLFVAIGVNIYSQKAPKVVLNDSSQLKLVSIAIDVQIIGNFATTTYDMNFYNGLDRTLEGELTFPLGENQAVSKFAMEVNGKLREAVIVEKEIARVAYENTIRQQIDPGLLEKTQGNNYKARVYPILPKKNKNIIITYEQELFSSNNHLIYELPLGITENLKEFSLNMNVIGSKDIPLIKDNPYPKLKFNQFNNSYQLSYKSKNHTPDEPILLQIPNIVDQQKVLCYNDFFYLHKTLNPNTRIKKKPQKVTILWDCSFSLRNRKLEEEIQLLHSYFNYLQNVEVQFINFSNVIHQNNTSTIVNGNWQVIENVIRSAKCDGGTSFGQFKKLNIKSDEILFFTDGMSNLGEFSEFNKSSIYTINSCVSANHQLLNQIASNSGGNYINLIRLPNTEAFKILKQETFQFLGIKPNKSILEVYPYKNTNVNSDFSLSGKFLNETTITLLFGYRNKVTNQVKIPIKNIQSTKLVKRLWAKQKLKFLNENKDRNKDAIISLAKNHHLITDFTSMLILDRIEDYARYKIEPPEELKKEYKEYLKNMEANKTYINEEIRGRREELFDDYAKIYDWYLTKFPKKIINKNPPQTNYSNPNTNPSTHLISESESESENVSYTPPTCHPNIDTTRRIISGTILSSDGEPLPGVNVIIKGTTRGTISDFDGHYWINANENDELLFTFIGFINQTHVIETSNTINVRLNYDTTSVDEVIVVGYGQMRKSTLTGSISSVSIDNSKEFVSPSINQLLQGRASGVHINTNSDDTEQINIRGTSSMSLNNTPLYIVDGMILDTDASNPISSLSPEEIESIEVLKPENASKIYGSKAVNGLIIISTKKGKEANIDKIEAINNKISDLIEIKSWNPQTPYIKLLEKQPSVELAYKKYLEIRDTYSNSPSFFLDVSDFFDKKSNLKLGQTILTNLMELKLDNHELMRALAYKLEYYKQYDMAVLVYEKILELRPEEPQSYRDLALAYEHIGEIKKSYKLLYKIYNGELLVKDEDERFYGIEHLAYVELNRLVKKYGNKLNIGKNEKFSQIPVDIRVVIDWNHDDTDIDLWVIDPNGEKAYYENTETKIGGRMSEDLMDGYGPEGFMLKNAIDGEYKIWVDYYSDNLQKISGPTILKATFFTNYGRKNENKKTIVVRLDKKDEELEVGSFVFNKNK
jgi:tetratricopeptide (TPR) repeat protein